MNKKKIIKMIIISVVALLLLFGALIIYLAFKEIKEEEMLKQEIINYSNKDYATDDFSITVKTTGDCAYVEEAVKKFYKQISDNVKQINNTLSDQKLTNVLSAENLNNNRPDFAQNHTILKNSKNKINKSLTNISKLCNEKTLKNLLDKKKLDDEEYYYDLYMQLIGTEEDLKELNQLKKDMQEEATNFNNFFDKADEILNFLQKNDSKITYSQDGLYFNDNSTLNEYKQLYIEFTDLIDKMSITETSDDSSEKI